MEGNNPVEGLDIGSNNNEKILSNIDNFLDFLKNKDNKKTLLKVLNNESNNDLKKSFEEFLGQLNLKKRRLLWNDIDACTTGINGIKSIIIGKMSMNTGYRVGDNIHEQLSTKQQTVQNEQQTIQNEQQTIQNEQVTIEEEKKNTEAVSGFKELNDALDVRKELIKHYPELANQTNQDSKLYIAIKSEFEEKGVLKQLKESNHDDEFISNYILVHATLHEMELNPDTYHDDLDLFDKIVKNLDNACNIPDTKLDNFSSKNIDQTRKELFNESVGNKALIDRKDTSIKEHEKKYDEIFENMDEAKMIKWYGKFIEDDNLKDILARYNKNKNRISPDEYSQLITGIEKIKPGIDKDIKERVEEMYIISQIKGLTSCVGKNFEDSFQFNKANNIVDNQGVISINGNIDGINFSLRHDTNHTDARLQTTTTLTKTENSFSIGQNYVDSPFKLPNKEQIFDVARNCIDDNIADDFKNLDEYLQILQDNIDKKVSNKLYKNIKFTDHYMTNKIRGEKIVNKTIDLIQDIKGSAIGKEIENTNQNVFNFIDLIDFNINNSTVNKKEKIYKCISKIQEIVSDYGNSDKVPTGKYPEIITHYLADKNSIKETQKILNGYQSGGESIFDLLSHYTINSPLNEGKLKIINFNDLDRDLSGIQGNFSNTAGIWDENENKLLADIVLENKLKNI